MSENRTTYDWAGARGEKWRAQLSGMEAMLAPVDEPLIDALRLDAPYRIAEVGCGGGGTALEILRRAPAGSVVHGFDLSPALIEIARARAPSDAIAFEVADMATVVPERPYDRLASRFSTMFFDDPPAGFANLARWLAPEGRFAFAVWGPSSDNPWLSEVRDVVARFVELPQADPEAPGPFRYGDEGTLLALLDQAGFVELETHEWRGSLPLGGGGGPEEVARFTLASVSSFGELLASAGGDALENARRALTERFSDHQEDGIVRMSARVHIATGARR